MKIPFKNYHLFVDTTYYNTNKPTILFIHGFTGSSLDWKEIIPQIDENFSCIALDLIGHGQSSTPNEIVEYEQLTLVNHLKEIFDRLNIAKALLCGYSMGGRLSLSFAEAYRDRVFGLILESTSTGIQEINQRNERLVSDKFLAENIVNNGIDWFVDYWMNLPIFSSQKQLSTSILNQIKLSKLNNNPTGLANSLIGFSQGKMKSCWENLTSFTFPIQLIVGNSDEKYCLINEQMNKKFQNSTYSIVQNAGHNIHLEKPSDFVILVNRFLRTNFL